MKKNIIMMGSELPSGHHIDEEPRSKTENVTLIEDGVVINGERFEIGTTRLFEFNGYYGKPKGILEGLIRFKIYDDGENYGTDRHLGFVVVFKKQSNNEYEFERTLIDIWDKVVK